VHKPEGSSCIYRLHLDGPEAIVGVEMVLSHRASSKILAIHSIEVGHPTNPRRVVERGNRFSVVSLHDDECLLRVRQTARSQLIPFLFQSGMHSRKLQL
jgi:hypothetical protein